jgi:hypothetical protein
LGMPLMNLAWNGSINRFDQWRAERGKLKLTAFSQPTRG